MARKKSKLICYILALFLGGLGAHLFYIKKYKRGFLYLLFCCTYIPFILGWIDMFFVNKWFKQGFTSKEFENVLVNSKDIKVEEEIDRVHALGVAVQQIMRLAKKQIVIKSQEQNLVKSMSAIDLIKKETEINSEKQLIIESVKKENNDYILSIATQKIINLVKGKTIIKPQEQNLIKMDSKFDYVETKKQVLKSDIFYIKEDIILDKYAQLKTPKDIYNFLEGVKDRKNKNREAIIYSSNTFIRDSLKYANKSGYPCDFKPLFKYYTTFSDLDNEQLKWYFYWRERVLNGEYLDTDLSYIFLFIYELINYTFNDDAAFNISMIIRIWENYKERYPKLINYIKKWAFDFLFELEKVALASEWDEVRKIEASSIYNNIVEKIEELDKISFTLWKPYIQNFRETEFYKKNKRKVYSTFKQSIHLLNSIYVSQGINIIERWFSEKELSQSRYLFPGAVIGRPTKSIQYKIKSYNASEIMFSEVTALFRLSENIMRLNCGEKRQLKMEEEVLPEDFKELLMDKVMPATINVKVNNRFKLVQSSNNNAYIDIPKAPKLEKKEQVPTITFNMDKIKFLNKQSEELQNTFMEKGYNDDSDDIIVIGIEKVVEEEKIISINTLFESSIEDYQEFIKSLTEIELKFFKNFDNLKKSISEASTYCKQNSVMIGTFISGINEKANEYLDDNILEINDDYYIIYEDYESLVNTIRKVM